MDKRFGRGFEQNFSHQQVTYKRSKHTPTRKIPGHNQD